MFGPRAALEQLSRSAFVIADLISTDELVAAGAYDNLQEVAENIGLVRRFGQDAVQAALVNGIDLLHSTREGAQ